MDNLRPTEKSHIDADWCNGSTADSDSVSRGSSPLSVVIERPGASLRGIRFFAIPKYARKVASGKFSVLLKKFEKFKITY